MPMGMRLWLVLALSSAGTVALAGAPARIARTLAALDDLERACSKAESQGGQGIYLRIPLTVERQVLVELDSQAEGRDDILDYIYQSSLRARAAIEAGAEPRRPPVPPAPELARLAFREGFCHEGDQVVFPLATDRCPAAVEPFFARGELRRSLPALAGVSRETWDASEIARIHAADPTSRRVGWDRPAGGFVAEGCLISLDHPAIQRAIAAETSRALAAWPAGTRPLYLSLGEAPFYTDYSELSRASFVAWLKGHYKSVNTLRLVWGMENADFAPAMLPAPDQAGATASRWCDFAAFNIERFSEHTRAAAARVRTAVPGSALGLPPFRYAFAGSFALSGVDPEALAPALDVLEVSGASAMETDLAFALAGGKRAVVMPALTSSAAHLIPQQLHGCAAARVASWPAEPLASPQAIREAELLLRNALDARRLAPQCARLARAPRPIALLYSRASLRLAPPWAVQAAQTPYTRELANAYQAARCLDLGVTFLTSAHVAALRWADVRLLIIPAAHAEEENVVRNLMDFVELGGHLVIVAESFVSDERGREADYLERFGIEAPHTQRPSYNARPRPDLGGGLDDLVAADSPVTDLVPAPGGFLASIQRPLRATGLRQSIKVNVSHQLLAAYPDGTPAIATYTRGKGSVTYLAMPLAPDDLAMVLRIIAARAHIQPLVRLVSLEGGPGGVECRAVRDGSAILAYAWNTTAHSRTIALESEPTAAATDLMTGNAVPARTDKAGSLLGPLKLGPGDVALLRLLPPEPKVR